MNDFYTGEAASLRYEEIIPVYQAAFAGTPWFEVSKCADQKRRCVGGLSALAVGAWCETCLQITREEAYDPTGLTERFDALNQSRSTSWYLQENEAGVTLVAIAWRASAQTIAGEKYADVPEMGPWLANQVGDKEVIWLDEVFANKNNQQAGNLDNFAEMCQGFGKILGGRTVLFRTITPQMRAAAARDFGDCELRVPDRRVFVAIDLEGVTQ